MNAFAEHLQALISLSIWLHMIVQCTHMPEKYLNIEGFLEKPLKTKIVLKSTGESLQGLEKA